MFRFQILRTTIGMFSLVLVVALSAASASATTTFGHNLKSMFLMNEELTNLNQGSYGVVAKTVFEKQASRLREVEADPEYWFRGGLERTAGEGCTANFQCQVTKARHEFARYVGVDGDDVVFVDNASEGVNVAIRSVSRLLGSIDRPVAILYLDIAYGMVQDCIKYLSGDHTPGVAKTIKVVEEVRVNTAPAFPVYDEDDILKLVQDTISEHESRGGNPIALASFSHIVSTPGIVLPIKRLAALCHAHNITVLIDGAHAPGQIDLNVSDLGVDLYVGNFHKWLYSARGCAFLWTSPMLQPAIYPPVIESFSGYDAFDVYPGSLHSLFDWQGTSQIVS